MLTATQPSTEAQPYTLRAPTPADGAAIHALIKACPPLDLNSTYVYLLLGHHFSDSCVVAEQQGRIAGFVSGYVPPNQPDTFFVWQVAVHDSARGHGLGRFMLRHVLGSARAKSIRFLETTVSPSNKASRRMFAALAQSCDAELRELPLFGRELFGADAHEDEKLLRIGPIQEERLQPSP
jgi:L-2,4-diaminobutyric acid acetyltransferase